MELKLGFHKKEEDFFGKEEEDWDSDDTEYHSSYTDEKNVYYCAYIFNFSENREEDHHPA